MTRGRKKGGLKINSLKDRDEIEGMIINQINSLNKKIKAFQKEGIEEHAELVKALLTSDMAQFTSSGTISKSKKFYDSKNKVWLKKTLATLHKLNNNELYGTTTKYKREVTQSIKSVQDYTKEYLKVKGYDDKFITSTITSKDFLVKMYDAFNNDTYKGYTSDQIIEKIALQYGDSGFSKKETKKILSNIEYSRNVAERLKEEQQAFEEFKRNKKMR